MRGPDVRLALLQVIITVGIARELAAAAIKALAKLGPKARAAVPALLRSAANDEPSIRSLAVGALATIGDRTVIPSLQGLLEDKDQFVREAARESLEKLSDAEE
jgi:HEAT repeat protein